MSSAACVGEITAVKKVALLRQTPLEMTRESRPGDGRLIISAFAELMLRRGWANWVGEKRHRSRQRRPTNTNLWRSLLTPCLMFVNTVGVEIRFIRIPPYELKGVAQHQPNPRGGRHHRSKEDQNASTGLKRILEDGDSFGNKGCLLIERAG
jgi:hypothetical protein